MVDPRCRRTLGLFFSISLLLLLVGVSAVSAESQSGVSVRVDHTITVLDWGLVVVKDTVTLTNGDTVPVSSFLMGVPERVGSHLNYAFVQSDGNETLGLNMGADLGKSGFRAVEITFNPVSGGGSCRFSVTFVFSGLIAPSATGYYVTVPMYPSLNLEAEQVNAKVILPVTVTVTGSPWSVDDKPSLDYTQEPLEAYADRVSDELSFTGSLKIVECESAGRDVILDPLGEIVVRDSYSLKNVGSDSFDSLDFTLLKGAHNAMAQDEFGNLTLTSKEAREAPANVTVNLRYSLRGSPYDDAYSFTLVYRLPPSLYVTRLDTMTSSQMSFNLLPDSKWMIRSLRTTITLPEGAEFDEANPQPIRVEKVGLNPVISYSVANATPYSKLEFLLRYRYLIFWSAFRPTLWVGLGVVAVCSLIGFRKLRRPSTPSAAVPTDTIRSYVEVIDEKAALRLEMESLDEDLERDRIRRHDYRRRARQIARNVQQLDKELEELKRSVRAIGPRYAEIVRRVEIAESEYDTARSNAMRLEATYREGKVSKDAYARLREDLYKRMDRAKTAIEGVTISLREEVR